jgi:hypothetical protein
MPKRMISARPGALTEVARRRGITMQELAAQAKVDPKTLRKIDNGHPVKEITLESITVRLRIDGKQLLKSLPLSRKTQNSFQRTLVSFNTYGLTILRHVKFISKQGDSTNLPKSSLMRRKSDGRSAHLRSEMK